MNQTHHSLVPRLLLASLAFFLCSCHGGEHLDAQNQFYGHEENIDADSEEAYVVEETIVEPIFAPRKHHAVIEDVAAADLAPTEIAPAAPIIIDPAHFKPDPALFYRDPFAGPVEVPPWLAMYVGSYGLLPTRFQDKGPFLYSFDVSKEAALSEDNNLGLGPVEFFHGINDDGDEDE